MVPFFEWGQVQKLGKKSTKNEITTKIIPFTQENIANKMKMY